jgi:hypothetical protein
MGGNEGRTECRALADRASVRVRVCAMILAVRGTENKTPISLSLVSATSLAWANTQNKRQTAAQHSMILHL